MKGEIIDVVIIIHIYFFSFLVINEAGLQIKGYRLGENE